MDFLEGERSWERAGNIVRWMCNVGVWYGVVGGGRAYSLAWWLLCLGCSCAVQRKYLCSSRVAAASVVHNRCSSYPPDYARSFKAKVDRWSCDDDVEVMNW